MSLILKMTPHTQHMMNKTHAKNCVESANFEMTSPSRKNSKPLPPKNLPHNTCLQTNILTDMSHKHTPIFTIYLKWLQITSQHESPNSQNIIKGTSHDSIFQFSLFPHLLIFLQFRDPSCVLKLIPPKQSCRNDIISAREPKYLHFELIFRRAYINSEKCF